MQALSKFMELHGSHICTKSKTDKFQSFGILDKLHFRPEIWSFENRLQFVMVTNFEQLLLNFLSF